MKEMNQGGYIERRQYFTKETFFTAHQIVAEIKNAEYGEVVALGHSLTDQGLIVDFGINPGPPIGTVVEVIIKRHTGAINKHAVTMLVAQLHPDGEYELVFLN